MRAALDSWVLALALTGGVAALFWRLRAIHETLMDVRNTLKEMRDNRSDL